MSGGNQNNTRFFVVLVLLAAGLLLWLVLSREKHSWQEEYSLENKNPYDLWLFRQLTERSSGSRLKPITDSLEYHLSEAEAPENSVYMLAGSNAYYDSSEVEALIDFAGKGGEVFILSRYQSYRLLETLLSETDEDSVYFEYWYEPALYTNVIRSESARISVRSREGLESAFTVKKVYENEVVNGRWAYFEAGHILESPVEITPLGLLNDSVSNYIMIPVDKGAFYLHACPMAFSNYHLREEEGLKYAMACLSHLENKGDVFWDEYSTLYKTNSQTSGDVQQQAKGQDGPLSFILNQKSLRWAWFVLLFGSVLFLLAGLKRKQRAIPLILPRGNSSLLFAETLSDMYKLGDDHSRICKLKWKMFQHSVRRNYGINIQFKDEAEKKNIVSRLAIRSGIQESDVEAIFAVHFKTIVSERVNHVLLAEFHRRLQYFYTNAK